MIIIFFRVCAIGRVCVDFVHLKYLLSGPTLLFKHTLVAI